MYPHDRDPTQLYPNCSNVCHFELTLGSRQMRCQRSFVQNSFGFNLERFSKTAKPNNCNLNHNVKSSRKYYPAPNPAVFIQLHLGLMLHHVVVAAGFESNNPEISSTFVVEQSPCLRSQGLQSEP